MRKYSHVLAKPSAKKRVVNPDLPPESTTPRVSTNSDWQSTSAVDQFAAPKNPATTQPARPARSRKVITPPKRFVEFPAGFVIDTSSNVGMTSDTRHLLAVALKKLRRHPPKMKADRRSLATLLRVSARCVQDVDLRLAVCFAAVAQEFDPSAFGLEAIERLVAKIRGETPPPITEAQQEDFFLDLMRVLQDSLPQTGSPNVTTSGISEPIRTTRDPVKAKAVSA